MEVAEELALCRRKLAVVGRIMDIDPKKGGSGNDLRALVLRVLDSENPESTLLEFCLKQLISGESQTSE